MAESSSDDYVDDTVANSVEPKQRPGGKSLEQLMLYYKKSNNLDSNQTRKSIRVKRKKSKESKEAMSLITNKKHITRQVTNRRDTDPLKILKEINLEKDDYFQDVKAKLERFTKK